MMKPGDRVAYVDDPLLWGAGLVQVVHPNGRVSVLFEAGTDRRPEFVAEVGRALVEGGPRRERSELLRGESWEARVDELRAHVAALLDGRWAA